MKKTEVRDVLAFKDALKNVGADGAEIILHGGLYPLNETLEVPAKTVIRGAGDGAVRFVGSIEVKGSDVKRVESGAILGRVLSAEARANLHMLKLADYVEEIPEIRDQYAKNRYLPIGFYQNEIPLKNARFPRRGDSDWPQYEDGFTKNAGTEVLEDSKNNRSAFDHDGYDGYIRANIRMQEDVLEHVKKYHEDACKELYMFAYLTQEWRDQTFRVRNFDTESGTFLIEGGTVNGTARPGSRYFFFNLPEEIARPGDYYLDREEKILYFWPVAEPSTSEFLVSILDKPMFRILGDGVAFRNVEFKFTRGGVIRAENISHLTVNGCNFYAIMDNVVDGKGLFDFRFLNNTVRNLGYIGISLEDCGDFPTLKSSEIHIINNDIGDVGNVRHTYSGAISLRRCVGVTMRYNDLHDCPHMLVNLGEGGAPCVNVVLEYNHIYNAVYECDDSAAVYWGRNANNLGTVISHNYFHDIGNDYTHGHSNAIYCDDYGVMAHVYNNVFYRGAKPDYCKQHHYSTSGCAVYGRANFGWVHNNIFVDNPTSCKLGFGDTTPVYLRLVAGSAIPYLRETVGAKTDFFYCECNRSNGADHMTPMKQAGFFGKTWKAYYKDTIWAPIFDLLSEQTFEEMMAIVEKHCGKYYTQKELEAKADLVYMDLYRYTQRKSLLNNRFDGNINISTSEWHAEPGKRFKNTGELMYMDNAPVDKDIISFGNYTADDDKIDGGKSMFAEYGKDFTLTEEGLAYIRKTVPDFKPFDVTCAGRLAEPVKEEDVKSFWMPKHPLPPLPIDYVQADEDGKQAFLDEQDKNEAVCLSDLLNIKHPWTHLEKKYEVPQIDGNPFFPYEENQSAELSYDESVCITDRSLKLTLKPDAKFGNPYACLRAKVIPIAGKPLDLWNYKQLILDVEHNDKLLQTWFLFGSAYGIARRVESVYEGWDRFVFDLDMRINTNTEFFLNFDVSDEPGMTVRVGKIELVEKDGK